jgi:hypothetical protein
MNIFYQLFEVEDKPVDHYSFLYFRTTPRGTVKFGLTHLPWERLRMQQQGTDELIQFDHIWMTRSWQPGFMKVLEDALKAIYKDRCLHNKTNRAGHTEWYSEINPIEFENHVNSIVARLKVGNIRKIQLKAPYTATKSSECPFGSPSNSRHQSKEYIKEWASRFWRQLLSE